MGWGRESVVLTFHQECLPSQFQCSEKAGTTWGSSGKVPFGWTSSPCPQAGTERQGLSLGSQPQPAAPPLFCSHCHLVDYKGYWFLSNSHFSVAFYGKCTLAVGPRAPHQKDPRLFSNTSLLHSQFIYDSDESVFSGNTHFTFWPRSIC